MSPFIDCPTLTLRFRSPLKHKNSKVLCRDGVDGNSVSGENRQSISEEASVKILGEDLVHPVANLLAARWFQVPHSALNIRVSHPKLDRRHIDSIRMAASGKGGAELVKPEILRGELGAFCYSFETVKEVELRVATRGREEQVAFLFGFAIRVQLISELCRERDLALFVCLSASRSGL
jgi:hypothetical protein